MEIITLTDTARTFVRTVNVDRMPRMGVVWLELTNGQGGVNAQARLEANEARRLRDALTEFLEFRA